MQIAEAVRVTLSGFDVITVTIRFVVLLSQRAGRSSSVERDASTIRWVPPNNIELCGSRSSTRSQSRVRSLYKGVGRSAPRGENVMLMIVNNLKSGCASKCQGTDEDVSTKLSDAN